MGLNNILEAIKKQDKFIEIPDCGRNDLPSLFKHLDFRMGAEIGVYKGEFTKVLLDGGLKVYGVDPWIVYEDFKNNRGQDRLNFQYDHTRRYLDEYIKTGQCELVRKTSMEALKDFPNKSLDFVYIDANHLLKYVVEDIVGWAEKIKDGGVICGHDFFRCAGTRKINACHVQYAVEAYVGSHFVPRLFVLGRKEYHNGETRDKWRSWMFFREYPKQTPEVVA